MSGCECVRACVCVCGAYPSLTRLASSSTRHQFVNSIVVGLFCIISDLALTHSSCLILSHLLVSGTCTNESPPLPPSTSMLLTATSQQQQRHAKILEMESLATATVTATVIARATTDLSSCSFTLTASLPVSLQPGARALVLPVQPGLLGLMGLMGLLGVTYIFSNL